VKGNTLPAIPGVKEFPINTKEYSNISKMFARTILDFSNVSSPYESYNTLNSQGEFAISEKGRSPWARAPSGNSYSRQGFFQGRGKRLFGE
jgi:hypothetical protein